MKKRFGTGHKCPVDGCEERLPRHLLMCAQHWRLVPKALQGEVYRAWRGSAGDYLVARGKAVALVSFRSGTAPSECSHQREG